MQKLTEYFLSTVHFAIIMKKQISWGSGKGWKKIAGQKQRPCAKNTVFFLNKVTDLHNCRRISAVTQRNPTLGQTCECNVSVNETLE